MKAGTVWRACALAISLVLGPALAGCSTQSVLETMPAETRAPLSARYAAHVVDVGSGRVVLTQDANAVRYPASLTKMMTLYMLFDAIEAGRIDRGATIPVSAYAAAKPPSKLGLKAGDQISVDTAIRALAVKSANDVAAAVGEHLYGSETAFAQAMTSRARQLGLRSTRFVNASGLPDAGQVTTAADMTTLGILLMTNHQRYYPYFSQREFTFRGRTIRGHNHLLKDPGVDGIKTGYIRASGFNIVTSVKKGPRRYVVTVMGGDSARERDERVRQIIASLR
ncbi:D-alanyl-D-alanine carboxypeptidase family protein [Notoacmeibacter sp. MSK16QG-6]|uniref:D-alanyl-D-alanine carboxypeptidase family protein n=1 Tax=Notoacmeibacter sp. MSK16QG-6 TaxID=2957982 RepID=UPI00209E45EE|nr:D-alanyl-D-alanine carboxypeptidase family protein [Notoacmeibacter sp. MSK16QG-6]MCP1200726.1 D-alanyl-D-alanine carboxypeptidase [Notoacmeibacter sp. MSK16QG-6]